MTRYMLGSMLALLLFGGTGCASRATFLDNGVPHMAMVRPGVYRSAQPTTLAQWQTIKDMGVRHVLKLNFPSEGRDDLAVQIGLDVHIMSIQPEGDRDIINNILGTFARPNEETLVSIGRLLLTATPDDAWLVHCTHGQDRTGLVVGRDRVLHGWTHAVAYQEMLDYGFHLELFGLRSSWEDWNP